MATTGGSASQARNGGVVRVAASGAALIALTRAPGGGASLERLRSDDEGWQAIELGGEPGRAAGRERVELTAAAGGQLIALASGESLHVSRDGGVSFQSVALPSIVALAFAGDSSDAPLLALVARSTDEVAWAVMVPAQGAAERIAEVAAGVDFSGEDDGETFFEGATMRWDASRDVAWIGCRAGLLALARPRKH
jgi:hypothetical protein